MNHHTPDPGLLRETLDAVAAEQQRMQDDLIALAEINSGSFNVDGVNAVNQFLQTLFADLGGQAEVLPVAPLVMLGEDGVERKAPLGQALRIRKRPDAPLQIVLAGHLDTVFPVGHPFQKVRRLDADRINGPGVADLKGGLIVMHAALAALERTPLAAQIGWEVLLNPDEEIGSQGSAPLLAEAAERCDLGLLYEPSFADGNLAGARKGSGNFGLLARGRAAHAGREHHLGRNAIRALCDALAALDDLNGQRDGVTINPGFIHGGGAVNIVPDTAMARFNVRLEQAADAAWCQRQFDRIVAEIDRRDGISLSLHGGFTRMPKVLDAPTTALFELVRACGQGIGVDLSWHPTGGCCDGNNLAAAGLPNVDTLGVHGGDIHSDQEWMRLSSLTERAQLSTSLLLHLASGAWSRR